MSRNNPAFIRESHFCSDTEATEATEKTTVVRFVAILAKAGIHNPVRNRVMDSRLRGNDVYFGQPCEKTKNSVCSVASVFNYKCLVMRRPLSEVNRNLHLDLIHATSPAKQHHIRTAMCEQAVRHHTRHLV